MKNITLSFENIDEIEDLIYPSVDDTSCTLIQIFCATADLNTINKIQNYFKKNFPKSILIGSTTDGIINGMEVYNATKNIATFTIFEQTTLKSELIKYEDAQYSSYEAGQAIASKIVCENTKVIISFADGINTNGEDYVNGISSIASEVTVTGGLAADNGNMLETYIFDKKEVTSAGAVGVSLNSNNLNISTKYTFDWMPVGKKLIVTKSVKNRIYEIDGMSAVDVYAKYFGYELANQLPQVGIEFPLIFEKNGVSIGRAVLLKHNDGSLTFAGNIPEGTAVNFGVGSLEKILQNGNYHIGKLLDEIKYEAEAVFVYSCMARRRFMNENMIEELEVLKKVGHVSGFFTYGEFFHSNDANQLLNETMTLIALSENKNSIPKNIPQIPSKSQNYTVKVEHVLAHLANTISKELESLNNNLEQRIKESSDLIYKQAYFDKLTKLPNRLSLIQRLDNSIGKMIFLINIDDFATINDFYGHAVGDKLLQKIAVLLQALMKYDHTEVFKLPSDEFAVILNAIDNTKLREKKINEYLLLINHEKYFIGKDSIHISATIASAILTKNQNGLVNADMVLKLAKKSSKEFMHFDEDLNLSKKYEENIAIVSTIKYAIANEKIIPYFQPLLNTKTGTIDKYEALVRLVKEDGDVLSPLSFLGISKKTKLYSQITEIMIEKTFFYFRKNNISFSINLSFDDILHKKTRSFLFEKIVEYDIASQLTIEILETQANEDEVVINDFIKDIYACGANIAIDDFGSGYANFQHMTTIRSDYMKIDGSLIKNIDKDENAKLIVETIIIFAKKLNKKVVAEFVHSKEVYDIIAALDVDYMQGYYIGKPLKDVI